MINQGAPVEPRPAASVVLVRGRRPWQVLMLRRPGGADFAPGAWVFPGGSVHAEDAHFSDPLRSAALRELFEEAGVLLARSATGPAAGEAVARVRDLTVQGRAWPNALATAGLSLRPEQLTLFARWITPELIRKRFDTYFYLARMPAGQEIRPQPGEIEEWRWIEPASALADPGLTLVFATRRILESIAGEEDPGRLVARMRRRRRHLPVMPRIVETAAGWEIVI